MGGIFRSVCRICLPEGRAVTRFIGASITSFLASACACMAAVQVPHPVPGARCPAVPATQKLDAQDPASVLRWRNGPPILYAMGRDRHDRLRALLAHGADPSVCLLGFSVMELAVSSGDMEEVTILLDAGAHPDLPLNSEGGTPLLSALQLGRFDIGRLLIARGADMRIAADSNMTALYALASAMAPPAMHDDQAALARTILDAGVAVDAAMGKPRITALMMAAIRGNKPLVEVLLESGADPRLEDNKGQTALTFAQKRGHTDVAELLSAATTLTTGSVACAASAAGQCPTVQRKSP